METPLNIKIQWGNAVYFKRIKIDVFSAENISLYAVFFSAENINFLLGYALTNLLQTHYQRYPKPLGWLYKSQEPHLPFDNDINFQLG